MRPNWLLILALDVNMVAWIALLAAAIAIF
jgi:hypothetical protein